MSLVLAIEPDSSQADLLRQLLRDSLGAELELVTSKDAALAALDRQVPDLILVTALLSPRDEDEIVAHLRSLDDASHLQTLTIPQLRRVDEPVRKSSLFDKFRKKGPKPAASGCDPSVFAEEVSSYLARAREVRHQRRSSPPRAPIGVAPLLSPVASPELPQIAPVEAAIVTAPLDPWSIVNPPRCETEVAGAAWLAAGTGADPAFDTTSFEPGIVDAALADEITSGVTAPPPTGVLSEEEPAAVAAEPLALDRGHYSERVGPHPHTQMLGDSAPRIGSGLPSQQPQALPEDLCLATWDPSETTTDVDEAPLVAAGIEAGEPDPGPSWSFSTERLGPDSRTQMLGDSAPRIGSGLPPQALSVDRLAAESASIVSDAPPPRAAEADSIDELEQLIRGLGVDPTSIQTDDADRSAEGASPEVIEIALDGDRPKRRQRRRRRTPSPELGELVEPAVEIGSIPEVETLAAEVARVQADAEARLAAELERVRADAEARRAWELAELQAEAAALREAAVGQARQAAETEAREALSGELARVRAEAELTFADALNHVRGEAEQTLQAEINRAREYAEQIRQVELARVQAEADERCEVVAREAKQEAEQQAARAFAEELARVRAEAERTFSAELGRVRSDAEQALMGQLGKARAEADDVRDADLARAQAEAEALRSAAAQEARAAAEAAATRALEEEVARVRAEAEARLRAELDRVRKEAADARLAEQSEAKLRADEIREASAREARAIAEAAASRTLEAEIARVRAATEARLAADLAKVKAEGEARQQAELEEIRRQVAEMREAAAEQARSAAAEAIAAEVARAASESKQTVAATRKQPGIIRVQSGAAPPWSGSPTGASAPAATPVGEPPSPSPGLAPAAPASPFEEPKVLRLAPEHQAELHELQPMADVVAGGDTPSTGEAAGGPSDYYSLWRAQTARPTDTQPTQPATSRSGRFRRTKWALPVAASLLLVVGDGVSIDVTSWLDFSREEAVEEAPAEPEPVAPEPEPVPVPPPPKPVGTLQVESTPSGARILLDGQVLGESPLTLPEVAAGRHTLVIESSAGTVMRAVAIHQGQTTAVNEAIMPGWLAVFSRIPLNLYVSGRQVGSTDDGQIMMPPGRHEVQLVNEQFGYRKTESYEILPGKRTTHNVALPTGVMHINAVLGAEVWIEGELVGHAPMRDVFVPIGTREILVRHPEFGERREFVDVRAGQATEVTLGLTR